MVFYTIPFGFSLFRNFRVNIFYFGNHFVWRRINDEGSLPEMRIWSILLIKSELKWCIHLSRSLFYISETAVGGTASYFVKIIWCSRCFCNPPPYFEVVYCFICGRRRVAVARYRMICIVLVEMRMVTSLLVLAGLRTPNSYLVAF